MFRTVFFLLQNYLYCKITFTEIGRHPDLEGAQASIPASARR
ncbi:hypothetical protein MITSMUL_03340 [Mitsuokella multacida DSM 20544]|uniref:Uncharacterized protein n=1 Tax=Mitsuokella multacida DSM 20544 TaxID=500635 RepID=C9KIT9_9FIRM|nr:hypothetical protein MITSMUL_03340 [Mitsuokella multacida DSM 20544]